MSYNRRNTSDMCARFPARVEKHGKKITVHEKRRYDMSRPTTKAELMTAAAGNYKNLNALISGLTEKELSTAFDFSADEKKK
ncbi:MAG: hypothetical protein Q4G07_10105, partial [Oscillospiraceae bacterium]|nr:hypothetical protein [Oscillospiraceae bacterium]